jgi:hypothetical protein
MSRRLLQVTNLILALLTIFLAGASVIFGTNSPIYGSSVISAIPALDSNLRFAGGMGLGLGVALVWITPRIERHTTVFRLVWICALLGGLGRLVSYALVGQPPMPMLVFTLIEVPGAPLLIWWQNAVASRSVA